MNKNSLISARNKISSDVFMLENKIREELGPILITLSDKQASQVFDSGYTIKANDGDNCHIKAIGSFNSEVYIQILPDYERDIPEVYQKLELNELELSQLLSLLNVIILCID